MEKPIVDIECGTPWNYHFCFYIHVYSSNGHIFLKIKRFDCQSIELLSQLKITSYHSGKNIKLCQTLLTLPVLVRVVIVIVVGWKQKSTQLEFDNKRYIRDSFVLKFLCPYYPGSILKCLMLNEQIKLTHEKRKVIKSHL